VVAPSKGLSLLYTRTSTSTLLGTTTTGEANLVTGIPPEVLFNATLPAGAGGTVLSSFAGDGRDPIIETCTSTVAAGVEVGTVGVWLPRPLFLGDVALFSSLVAGLAFTVQAIFGTALQAEAFAP